MLAIIDGNAGLRRAVGLVWPRAAVQRCCVHELRSLERKAPKHALAAIRDDFHRIVYAANTDTARIAYTAFERRLKTQGSLQKIGTALGQHASVAAR
jgi:transposase-like protein